MKRTTVLGGLLAAALLAGGGCHGRDDRTLTDQQGPSVRGTGGSGPAAPDDYGKGVSWENQGEGSQIGAPAASGGGAEMGTGQDSDNADAAPSE